MLFSQNKERENRFITALKIALPIILILLYLVVNFKKEPNNDVYLFVILIFIYVYYITYLIYLSFKMSLLDSVTNTFKRDKIYQIITKNNNSLVVLFGIKNYSFIINRYGIDNAEKILQKFIIKIDKFLKNQGYKNTAIGIYSNAYFLMNIDEKIAKFRHIFTILEKQLVNFGIDDIEIKLNFAMIENQGKKIEEILWQLNDQIHSNFDEKILNLKLDINKCELIFKWQRMYKFDENDENLNIIFTRLKVQNHLFSKQKMANLINKSGNELQFDKKNITMFFENEKLPNGSFIIEISAISIRNLSFRNFIFDLINSKKIDPKCLIFEFYEDEIYDKMKRFNEIIAQYRNLGIRFALGRFGADNASFVYLKHLNIDFIVYDIEILKNLNNQKYMQILQKYSEISRNLGIKTLMKFVDQKEIFDTLNKQVDYVSGFYISKPKIIERTH